MVSDKTIVDYAHFTDELKAERDRLRAAITEIAAWRWVYKSGDETYVPKFEWNLLDAILDRVSLNGETS